MLAPGDCSPSRKVVSKIRTRLSSGPRCRWRRGLTCRLCLAHESALSSVVSGFFGSDLTHGRIRRAARFAAGKPRPKKKPRDPPAGGSRGVVVSHGSTRRRTLRCPPRPDNKGKAKVQSKVRCRQSHGGISHAHVRVSTQTILEPVEVRGQWVELPDGGRVLRRGLARISWTDRDGRDAEPDTWSPQRTPTAILACQMASAGQAALTNFARKRNCATFPLGKRPRTRMLRGGSDHVAPFVPRNRPSCALARLGLLSVLSLGLAGILRADDPPAKPPSAGTDRA